MKNLYPRNIKASLRSIGKAISWAAQSRAALFWVAILSLISVSFPVWSGSIDMTGPAVGVPLMSLATAPSLTATQGNMVARTARPYPAMGNLSLTVPTSAAALAFDGTDDYVNIPHNNALNITGALTIEAWIKTSRTVEQYITTKNEDSFFFGINGSSDAPGKLSVFLWGASSAWTNSNATVADGTWHHVAFTRSGTNLSLFIDGALDKSVTVSGSSIPTGTSTLLIGNRPRFSGTNFLGSIDEVRIWNRARTQCEIVNNKNCELPSGQTGLVAYYKFNQGVDGASNTGVTSLTDASGTGNTGTLTNFALSGSASNWVAPGGVTTGVSCAAVGASIVNITAAPSLTITQGQSATLTASGATTYKWSTGATTAVISATTAATYSVTGTTGVCSATASVGVVVSGAPSAAALAFDGNDDKVIIPHNDIFNITNDLTMEAWIKTTKTSEQFILTKGENSFYFALNGDNKAPGKLSIYLRDASSDWTNSNGTVTDGNWHHVAFTRIGTNLSIFIDGVLDKTGTIGGGSLTTGTSELQIGSRAFNNNINFLGNIDEVRIWNRALAQCEIINNKNCELKVAGQTGLVAYYQFNQGVGEGNNTGVTSLTDATGSGNTGTLTNFDLTGSSSNWVTTGGVTTGVSCTTVRVPTVSIAAAPSLIVSQGQSATLTASGADSYTWSTGATSATILVGTSGPYSVTGNVGLCTATASTVFSSVTSSITLAVAASSAAVCAGGTVGLSVVASGGTPKSPPNPYSYTWTAPAGVILSGTSTSAVSGTAITSGLKTFTITVTDANSAVGTKTVDVLVNASPTVSIAASPSLTVIQGNSVALTASGANAFLWNNNAERATLPVSKSGTYSVTGLIPGGCTATATVVVTVLPVPVIPQVVYNMQAAQLQPGVCPIRILAQGSGRLFEITGPDSYGFSVPFRDPVVNLLFLVSGVKKAGIYTFKSYGNPGQAPVVATIDVKGTGCP